MRLLIDENISSRLVTHLSDLFPGSASVMFLQMLRADDDRIWAYAKDQGLTILTRDDDFVNRSALLGHPPKVLYVSLGNCSTNQLEALIRWRFREICTFLEDPDAACLALA